MTSTQTPEKKPASKLIVRNKVLAAVSRLNEPKALSVFEKQKLIDQLMALGQLETMQDILMQELARAEQDHDQQDVLAELLIWVGDLEYLQEPLWEWIASPDVSDTLKDTLNLILKQLGDTTPTETYLQFLSDPDKLINCETHRMLYLSSQSPQARVDLLDFLTSLDQYNQKELLESLIEDFNPGLLCQLFSPLLASQPNNELSQWLLQLTCESQEARYAKIIADLYQWPEAYRPNLPDSLLNTHLKKLQLKGWYHPDKGWIAPSSASNDEAKPSLPLLEQSELSSCYVTLPDGLGNQAVLMSRQYLNSKDKLVCCFVINEINGVIDCFGFEQLAQSDYRKVEDRFLKNSLKTPVSPEYAKYLILKAEQLNHNSYNRLPYEFLCWLDAFEDVKPDAEMDLCHQAAQENKLKNEVNTAILFEHPDIKRAWFLDLSDLQSIPSLEQKYRSWLAMALIDFERLNVDELNQLLEDYVIAFSNSPIIYQLQRRLKTTSELLAKQQQPTLSKVAHQAYLELSNQTLKSKFLREFIYNSLLQWLIKEQLIIPKDQLLPLQTLVLKLNHYWHLNSAI